MNAAGKYPLLWGALSLFIFFQSSFTQAAPPPPTYEPQKSVITINKPPKTTNDPLSQDTTPARTLSPAVPPGQTQKALPATGKPLPRPTPAKPTVNIPPTTPLPPSEVGGVSPSVLQKNIKNPAQLSGMRQKLFVDIVTFTAAPETGKNWKWSAQVKNNGPSMIAAGRLQVKVVQKLLSGTSIQAGAPLPPLKALVSKEILSLSQSQWTKTPMTKQLFIEIWDSKKNQMIVSKSLSLPIFDGPEKVAAHPATAAGPLAGTTLANATPDPRFDYSIASAEYLGQGRFQAAIRNDGNIKIAANRLRISGRYYMGAEDILVPRIISSEILPGQTETVEVLGLLSDGECFKLTSIDVNVTDPDTGKDRYKDLRVHSLDNSTVTITDVSFRQGFLTASLQNTAPYRVKLKIKVKDIEIWDLAKPYEHDEGNLFEQAWDFMTGGVEFDPSGLQPEEHKCTAHNILITPIELSAGGLPQVNPTWSVPVSALQSAIRSQCPDVSFSQHSQIYKTLRVKAYTENISPCPASRDLDTHLTSEGGRDAALFSW